MPNADAAMAHRPGKLRLGVLCLLACFPSFLKRPLYRLLFGYRIGRGVRVGFSLLDAAECEIESGVSIGHLNVVIGVRRLRVGDHARIGHLNVIRGGLEVNIGRYAEIIRLNVINSIPDPEIVTPADPRFVLGAGGIIVAGHKIDFTDRVEIGRRSVLGGRNSSVWTHNRQRTKPVRIGDLAYIGSEIRVSPGATVPGRCIVGIGSVISGELAGENQLFAGVPAKAIKPLDADDIALIEHKTRRDLPDDI
jgi:carbonic anhydrase/acetyltransferase-like protein (isoleucine patch superfamily)